MLRVEQSSSGGASELDAPLDVSGINSVKETLTRTTPAEATHDYMGTRSRDAGTLSYLPPPSRGYDPLYSPSSLEPVHPRVGNEYMVGARFAKVRNTSSSMNEL